VEQSVASLPAVFSALTSALLALAAARLAADWRAGLVAGSVHATAFASLRYGALGNGDHHAFVSLLDAAMLLGLAEGLRASKAGLPRRAWIAVLAAGLLGGSLVATWVAGVIHIAAAQGAWALSLVLSRGQTRRSVFELALGWHLAVLIALLPWVPSSPWPSSGALALVTLSWLQPVAVVAGGTGLAALQFVLGGERPGGRRLALVLALLLVAVLGLRFSPVAPALAESFEWAAAGGEFMRFVRESQALYDDPSALLKHLGGAILLLPFALIAALTVSMRAGRTDFAPWIACAPPLLLLALAQRRFAEAAVLPTVVLLGWGASAALRRWRTTSALPVLPVGGLLFLRDRRRFLWLLSASSWRGQYRSSRGCCVYLR
jgi:asparagine N-glycosylation enzyme membrane subunit Stt3